MTALPPGALEAAQARDYAARERWSLWQRVGDEQLTRLLEGAAPLIAAQATAAERERILAALLGCTGCGRIHELREVAPSSQNPGGRDWRDPGDGHAYSAAWSTGPTPYVRIRELLEDPPGGTE